MIDTSTNQVVTQIPVGAFPIRIAMTPDRLKAFVSDEDSATISVLDTVALTNIATIPVDRYPERSLSRRMVDVFSSCIKLTSW